jgi:hypothetical protein
MHPLDKAVSKARERNGSGTRLDSIVYVSTAVPTPPQVSTSSVTKNGVQQNRYEVMTMVAVFTARLSSRKRSAEKLAFDERLFGIPAVRGWLFQDRRKFSGVPDDAGGTGRSRDPPLLPTISPGFAEIL